MLELIADNNVLRLVLLTLLFAGIAAVAFFGAQAFGSRQQMRRRLAQDGAPSTAATQSIGSLRTERAENAWLKLVNSIEKSGLSLSDTKGDTLRRKMVAAGYAAPYAPRVFTLVRLVMVVGLPLLLFSFYWSTASMPGVFKLYMTLVIAAALGLYLPNIYIRAKADRRQRELINGFPDALDLMLVCVEAGLGLEAAFARVGMEMTSSHPLALGAVRVGRARTPSGSQFRGHAPAVGGSGRRR